jgi:predicted transcriptional regulator
MLVEHCEPPVYVRIAGKVKHLRELEMSDKAIARMLGVSDKTVSKAAATWAVSAAPA